MHRTRLALLLALPLSFVLSGCWVTEQCGLPGDEDGDGLEGCEDPDCFSRPMCGATGREPVPDPGFDDDDDAFDDDDVDDDDDAFDDDDDDDEFSEQFSFTFDGAASVLDIGDDDDSADPDPGGDAFSVEVVFTIQHWRDINAGDLLCDQRVRLTGDLLFGDGIVDSLDDVGRCATCNGFLELDPATYEDLSDPAVEADDCAPDVIQNAGDLGAQLLTPAAQSGMGDFLHFGLIDEATLAAGGIGLTVDDAPPTDWQEFGMRRTHAAYVQATLDTLAGTAGLESVTLPPEAGSDYLAAFEIAQLETTPEPAPPTLVGPFVGQALFIFTGGL